MKILKMKFLYALLCFMASAVIALPAQNRSISGVVTDADTREPIIGATVVCEQSPSTGTVTDIDGRFTLSVPSGATLKVSYIGYTTANITVGNRTQFDIELKSEGVELEQLVVIGYGVQKKSDLTGSISSVQADDIRSMPTNNVAQALQGKAAGIEIVQNSGSPGASTSVRIRGTGTVNNSDPLYVVDGIPMDDINFLSADDIQSLEILKDAASAAIYGSRAANGVVLVTTKSGGEEGKARIGFNSYWGWQNVWRDPAIMTKDEFIYMEDYAVNLYNRTERLPNGQLGVKPEFADYVAGGTDWWEDITRTGFMQKYNLSVSGGTNAMNYYISGSYQMTEGTVKRSRYDRLGIVGKINVKLSKRTKLGVNLNYTNEDRLVVSESAQWGVVKQALLFSPLAPTFNSYGDYQWNTPVEMLRRTPSNRNRNYFVGQINFDWEICKGLTFNTRASVISNQVQDSQMAKGTDSDKRVSVNKYDVSRGNAVGTNFSWDNVLSYNTVIRGKHNLSAMVGQTLETSAYESNSAGGTGYGGYNDNYDALNFAKYNPSIKGSASSWRALGFIGRITYDYDGRYLFQTNFRADASSRFLKKRWGYFPSFSAGWKISGEDFMKDVHWISLLKLRAGWGQLGNNRVGDYVYGTYVAASGYYIYGDTNPVVKPAMNVSQIGNENVTWERTQSTNIGLDFNVLSNRLTLSVDAFNKETHDMLLSIPLPYYNGYTRNPVQNAGSVNNKGIEIQAAWKNSVGKFKYEIGGNITFIKNKITSLGQDNEPIYGGKVSELGYVNKTVVGAPIAAFYGWKTDGIIQEGENLEDIPTFATDAAFGPGDMKFVDINKDGIIDDNDKTFLGNAHPNCYYGFNLNMEYCGFDLSLFFQGVAGNKVYNATKFYMYSPTSRNSFSSNKASDYMDKIWRGTPGDPQTDYRSNWPANPNGSVPAPNTNSTINAFNFRNSDFYIEDGSYLRLKNVQLGYSFPKEICRKMRFSSLRLYASVTNLFTFTKYSGLDPEIGKTYGEEGNNLYVGIDQGVYPQARTYTFGLIFDL